MALYALNIKDLHSESLEKRLKRPERIVAEVLVVNRVISEGQNHIEKVARLRHENAVFAKHSRNASHE